MDIAQTTPQTINALFTFLSHMQNAVIWVCTADYKKQLYLSDGFESIWGIPKEQMYNDMSIWMKTLYQDDLSIINSALVKRQYEKNHCEMLNFRIQRPDSQIRCLKSTTATIFNEDGLPTVMIGVDENLPADQWGTTKTAATHTFPLLNQLSSILAQEFHWDLSAKNTAHPVKAININNKTIMLTDRESQCLRYLIEGRSAKETAYYLKISTRTVETYLDKIRSKTNCRTKIALIGKLKRQGDIYYLST